MSTPSSENFRQPAEWAPHSAVWVAWPWDASLWLSNLGPAQKSFAELCQNIIGERLEVLVPDADREVDARAALTGLDARFHRIPVGDIWLRDIAPVFVSKPGAVAAVSFGFNGWGGKYVLEHDDQVARRVARASGLRSFEVDCVMEGGSLEVDGEGTLLTSRQCLLNPNRNPTLNQAQIEAKLRDALGIEKFLWVQDGLLNDHTDGHIDTIARFVAPGRVLCMKPSGRDDPNRAVLEKIAVELSALTDAKGRKLEVVRVPSPGRVADQDGKVMAASYVNFYIANGSVVVPTYGCEYDDEAVRAVAQLFPTRRTLGVDAKAILSGGGAFHCITQQQPQGSRP